MAVHTISVTTEPRIRPAKESRPASIVDWSGVLNATGVIQRYERKSVLVTPKIQMKSRIRSRMPLNYSQSHIRFVCKRVRSLDRSAPFSQDR